MNWGELVSRVKTSGQHGGQPLIKLDGSEDAKLTAFLWETLARYTRLTGALFEHNLRLSTSTGWLSGAHPPVYNLLASIWEPDSVGYQTKVWLPVQVAVGGRTLRDLRGRPGPISSQELAELQAYGDPGTTEPDEVAHWCRLPEERIRLFPGPKTGFPTSVEAWISGYRLFPEVADNAHGVYLQEWEQDEAVEYCVLRLFRHWDAPGPRAEHEALLKAMEERFAAQFAEKEAQRLGL